MASIHMPNLNNEFLTVSQLNQLIQGVIQMGFPNSLWVCGEIQGYNRNRDKKHVFFELCEKDQDTKDILARIGLVIFSGRRDYIQGVLKESQNAFELKDDIEVKFLCRVDFYPPHGAVRLIVEDIDPVYTLGKIAQEKQKLIARLKEKGILDKNKQIELPLVPLEIGLITAFDSAAYNDFLCELKASQMGFKVYHRNALMQGKNAESSVCDALVALDKIEHLDVIVITRGGGSLAELACFDSEKIARCIAGAHRPVLSGIGHEINITITDLAAHTFQKTPTAVARFLVERVKGFLIQIQDKGRDIVDLADEQLQREKRSLRDRAINLKEGTQYFLKSHHQKIQRLREIIRLQPLRTLKGFGEGIFRQQEILLRAVTGSFKNRQKQLLHFERLVELARPDNTIKRGFSITRRQDGRLLKSVKDVAKGDLVKTQLRDGNVESAISSIKRGEQNHV